MDKKRHVNFLLVIFLLIAARNAPLSAWDFGFITRQLAAYNLGTADEEGSFEYKGSFIPRFSYFINDTSSIFVSASMTIGVDDGFYYVPELLRTEYTISFGPVGLSAGRIPYSDPLSFIADGLFDGARASYTSKIGRLSTGFWYTGFLYKKSVIIQMTEADQDRYDAAFDYADFINTYFTPSRILVAADWEHPSILEILNLKAAINGQFDLSNAGDRLNSLYLTLKASVPVSGFLFEAGGSIEGLLFQNSGADNAFKLALAGELGIFWTLPGNINSRLSLTGKFTSGYKGEDSVLGAFIPVTTKHYGDIFTARMTALSVLSLNYTARFENTFGMTLTGSYFMRSDTETANSFPIAAEGDGGQALGAEFFARIIISPSSDLQINLGVGAFFPGLGDNWPEEKPICRIEASVIFAIF
jgi:hypothetical protein